MQTKKKGVKDKFSIKYNYEMNHIVKIRNGILTSGFISLKSVVDIKTNYNLRVG